MTLQPELQKDYSILTEIGGIASRHDPDKPDIVSEADWVIVSHETKDLLIQIEQFKKPLEQAYRQAVRQRDWERALVLYQRFVGTPLLFGINPLICSEQESLENEAEFISRAKDWVTEIEELLKE